MELFRKKKKKLEKCSVVSLETLVIKIIQSHKKIFPEIFFFISTDYENALSETEKIEFWILKKMTLKLRHWTDDDIKGWQTF